MDDCLYTRALLHTLKSFSRLSFSASRTLGTPLLFRPATSRENRMKDWTLRFQFHMSTREMMSSTDFGGSLSVQNSIRKWMFGQLSLARLLSYPKFRQISKMIYLAAKPKHSSGPASISRSHPSYLWPEHRCLKNAWCHYPGTDWDTSWYVDFGCTPDCVWNCSCIMLAVDFVAVLFSGHLERDGMVIDWAWPGLLYGDRADGW